MAQAKQDIIDRENKTWSSVAEGWKKHDEQLKKSGEPVTQRLIEVAAIQAGHRVLDIASGTGEPAIPMAQLVGETGFVVGTDLSDDMLAVAREKAHQLSVTNIEFHRVDGETLAFDPESFNATTMRWGLMFMPEPEKILGQIHGLLKDEGRIAVACWAEPERNPFFTHIMGILMKYMDVPKPPEGAPGVFAFANPDRLTQTLAQSGFRDVEIEDLEVTMFEADSGEEYWQMMVDIAGPITQLVQQMDNQTRDTFIRDVIDSVDAQRQGDKVRMRGTTWIAHGRK